MATTPPIRMRVVPEVDWSEIADGGVCQTCQAVVADMTAHAAWHGQVGKHVDQRIAGVERRVFDRVRALQEQAGGLIAEQAERLEQQERGLSSVWPRLRGVEDELRTADYLRTQENLCDEHDETTDRLLHMGHDVANADGELLARLGTDAQAWAAEFLNTTAEGDRDDFYLFVTWFANAIEAGRLAGTSEAHARNPARPEVIGGGRDQFLYDVASCGLCLFRHDMVLLCDMHRATVNSAREEVHGQ